MNFIIFIIIIFIIFTVIITVFRPSHQGKHFVFLFFSVLYVHLFFLRSQTVEDKISEILKMKTLKKAMNKAFSEHVYNV